MLCGYGSCCSSFGLLQEQFQILQVVACYDDKGALFNRQGNRRRRRRAVRRRVNFVEESHAGQVNLARFHDDGQEFIHAPVFAEGSQSLQEEGVDLFAAAAQHEGMIGIGCHAAQAEEDEISGADIFVGFPNLTDVIVAGLSAEGRFFRTHSIYHDLNS